MTIWIVAAVREELNLLLSEYNARQEEDIGGHTRFVATAGDQRLRFGVIGINIASASLALGFFLSKEKPEAIILVGSAGALPGSGLEVGDAVVADSEILAELGVVAGPGIGDIRPLDQAHMDQEIPFDRSLGDDLFTAAARSGHVTRGRLLTVVGVSASQDQAEARAKRFQAVAENMEGYAVALAGRSLGIKAAEVRGISNRAGDRDKANWDLKMANDRAQSAVFEYLRGSL